MSAVSYTDYSEAKPSSFGVIPAKTIVPIKIDVLNGDEGTPENAFAITKSGLYQMVLECTVTDGDYARRKFWQRLTMGAKPGVTLTDGQKQGVDISKQTLRAICEAARGFSPTDDSEKAVSSRKLKSLHDLSGMEFSVVIGVEEDTGYGEKNKIARVVPAGEKAKPVAKVAAKGKPAWDADMDDEIPF